MSSPWHGTTYEIGIWLTEDLYEYTRDQTSYDKWKAQDVAAQWIKDAMDYTPYDFSVVKGTNPIPQGPISSNDGDNGVYGLTDQSFDGDPCWDSQKSWGSSWDFWKDCYKNAGAPNCAVDKTAKHVRVLIYKDRTSNSTVVGLGAAGQAVASPGEALLDEDVNGHQLFGTSSCLSTILHEIGHNIVDSSKMPNHDGDTTTYTDHDAGQIVYNENDDSYYTSVMGVDGKMNNCFNNYHDPDKSYAYEDYISYSDCMLNYFRTKSEMENL